VVEGEGVRGSLQQGAHHGDGSGGGGPQQGGLSGPVATLHQGHVVREQALGLLHEEGSHLRVVRQGCEVHGVVALRVRGHQRLPARRRHAPQQHAQRQGPGARRLRDAHSMVADQAAR